MGSNLQDHIMISIDALAENSERLGFSPFQAVNPFNYIKWFTSNPYNGPLADIAIGTGAFFHTPSVAKDPYKRPEIQLMSVPFYVYFEWGTMYKEMLGLSEEHSSLNQEHFGKDGVTLLPALLRPKSTGIIKLRSANHEEHPLIDPNYLKDPDDVKTLVEALKISKDILDSKHFK